MAAHGEALTITSTPGRGTTASRPYREAASVGGRLHFRKLKRNGPRAGEELGPSLAQAVRPARF